MPCLERRYFGFLRRHVRSRIFKFLLKEGSRIFGKLRLRLQIFVDEKSGQFAVHLARKLGRYSGVVHLEGCEFAGTARRVYEFNFNIVAHSFDRIFGLQQSAYAPRLGIEMKAVDCGLQPGAA